MNVSKLAYAYFSYLLSILCSDAPVEPNCTTPWRLRDVGLSLALCDPTRLSALARLH